MRNKMYVRVLLAAAIALSGLFGFVGAASAQTTETNASDCRNEGLAPANAEASSTGTQNGDGGTSTQSNGGNCQNEGDADGETNQEGSASSGDGVAGQVAGVVSAGDASVDATNRSDDVSVDTGNATGTNAAVLDVRAGIGFLGAGGADETNSSDCRNEGLAPAGAEASGAGTQNGNGGSASQTNDGNCFNSGDADGAADQSADAASGDGVGGQVIGVVTSAGGSADLVLDNESSDSDVTSGSGDFTNGSAATVDSGVFFTIAP